MTNDEAVALALYDLAEEILRDTETLKVGSGDRRASFRIGRDIYHRAKALDLGEHDDPAIQRSAAALRRNITEREATA